MAETKSDSKVTVRMVVESHNLPRGEKVKVSREDADRLIANQQAVEV